ncbi:tRNA (adenine(58)-N(1))-methyltransferase non-catalytic subunit TRM6 [Phytophthora cactorum]|nr:tRNA (adenine(58)-N(1))-methyltransferase non-catalytic subunit TRM6 [Phytophthora cactorum]
MATSSFAAGVDVSTETPRLPYVIYEGDTVICQTSDGRMFFQAVDKDESIRVGKKVASLKPVIGSFYGAIFEEQNKKLVKVTGGLFPDPVAPETGDGFVPDGDNRHYADTNSAQTLKQTDIGELREKGASGKEIIQKLVENSSTWDTKTEFSKQKYLKKKQQKYMPRVRFLRCTAESLCRTYRLKNPAKICNLREDSLGQMLVYGNIFAGGQVLVVDTCMGLVAGAIAERQGGSGRVICPYEGQQPAADILRRFNFDKRTLESIHYMPFKQVRMLEMRRFDAGGTRTTRAERAKNFTPEQQKRYAEKKARREQTKLYRQKPSTIRQWAREKSDSLLNETWTRDNQVLPGRTHPEMNMSACSGYLLSGIKILDIPPFGATSNASMNEQDTAV